MPLVDALFHALLATGETDGAVCQHQHFLKSLSQSYYGGVPAPIRLALTSWIRDFFVFSSEGWTRTTDAHSISMSLYRNCMKVFN